MLEFQDLTESIGVPGRIENGPTSTAYEVHLDSLNFTSAGRPAARVVAVSYLGRERDPDKNQERPVVFFFPGGPGLSVSSLVLGFGPRVVDFEQRDNLRLVDNSATPLADADLVFVDMPGAGFSRISADRDQRALYGIRKDAELHALVVQGWLTSHRRARSPVFIAGHSYGVIRAAYTALALASEARDIDLRGLILICGAWDLGAMDFAGTITPDGDLSAYWSAIPSFAAIAWHYSRVARRGTLEEFVAEARRFATERYAPALIRGGDLGATAKLDLARTLSDYVGLSPQTIAEHGLRIDPSLFRRQLIPAQPFGIDNATLPEGLDPITGAGSSVVANAWNAYLRELGLHGPDEYLMGSFEPAAIWDWNTSDTWRMGYPRVTQPLAELIKLKPDVRMLVAAGYFDLATPYFMIENAAAQVDEPHGRVTMKLYPSGHSLWIDPTSRTAANSDVRTFVMEQVRH